MAAAEAAVPLGPLPHVRVVLGEVPDGGRAGVRHAARGGHDRQAARRHGRLGVGHHRGFGRPARRGGGLGAALASAITAQQAGTATIVLPARQLLVDLALASTAGLIAAAVPARRAARLNPLTAIGTQ